MASIKIQLISPEISMQTSELNRNHCSGIIWANAILSLSVSLHLNLSAHKILEKWKDIHRSFK